MFKNLKNGLVHGLGIVLVVGISGIAYSELSSLKATTGETLTVSKWDSLVDHSVPTGFVGAFALSSCPIPGWSEYTPAYGRVIRGIDKSGSSIDPDGVRIFGSTQEDDFEIHNHRGYFMGYGANGGAGGTSSDHNTQNTYYDHWTQKYKNGSSVGGTETRPKNVALLYCIKD